MAGEMIAKGWRSIALRAGPIRRAGVRLEARNRTRGSVLATEIDVADNGASRNRGLLGRDRLEAGEGLWIVPCESVHTFFMRFPIDLVYLDRGKRVKKVRSGVGPWRLSACLPAHSVLELPAGTIERTRTENGDEVEFCPVPERSAAYGQGRRERAIELPAESVAASIGTREWLRPALRFHWLMAALSLVVLSVLLAGSRATLIRTQDAGTLWMGAGLTIAMMLPLPAHWQMKGEKELRDAALCIPWGLLLAAALPSTVAVAGRWGMGSGFEDGELRRLDEALGVHVPGLMEWASRHWVGMAANRSYTLLYPMLAAAFLLPALTGKVRTARRFQVANLIAFALGMVLFALLPAVGPWYGYHLAPNPAQAAVERSLVLLRTPGPVRVEPFGVVCLPSFHAIWAVLSVDALWCFRGLRIASAVLGGLILFSTMTTGWHYFADVAAGVAVAVAAITGARGIDRLWFEGMGPECAAGNGGAWRLRCLYTGLDSTAPGSKQRFTPRLSAVPGLFSKLLDSKGKSAV